jgi:hypothetical protein
MEATVIGDLGQAVVGRRVRAVATAATYTIAVVIPDEGDGVGYRLNPLRSGGSTVKALASDPAYYLAPADGDPPPAQRTGIGLVEQGPVGRPVCKVPPAMWEISAAGQADSGWQYTLKLVNIGQTKVVSGADPGWELADAPPDAPEALRAAGLIAGHPPALPQRASISAWRRTGPFLSVPMGQLADTGMLGGLVTWGANAEAEAVMTAGKADVVWSGGAADCVIVGAYAAGRAFLTHATQLQPSADDIGLMIRTLGPKPMVWLASQKFAASAQVAKDSGLIQAIASGLAKEHVEVTAIFSSDRLAIDVPTGSILANFANPVTEAFLQANPVQQAPSGALADLIAGGLARRVASGEVFNTAQVVPAQDADQPVFAPLPQRPGVLWSGTAKQEVIVGAHAKGNAVLVRCSKQVQPTSVTSAIMSLDPSPSVWLSSQAFAEPNATESKIIGIVAGALTRAQIPVQAIYATGRLAIKADTGQVLADFQIPET